MASRRKQLSLLVGDENGIMKHLYIPNVFAKPPYKPEKYRVEPVEPGEAPNSVDPEAKQRREAEIESYKIQVATLKPKVTAMSCVDGLSRLNGVDFLAANPSDGTLLMGRHNGVVQRWNPPSRNGESATSLVTAKLQDFVMADDRTNTTIKVRRQPGLNLVGMCAGPTPGSIVTCSALGRLRVSNLTKDSNNTIMSVSMGDNICKMRGFGATPTVVAMGGREVDLRIFDVARGEFVYKAKNIAHDWLDMRVPVWVKDVQFLPGHSGNGGSTNASTANTASSDIPMMGVATGYG